MNRQSDPMRDRKTKLRPGDLTSGHLPYRSGYLKKDWIGHNKSIRKYLQYRNEGRELVNFDKRDTIVRNYGCRHCPYYGTKQCFLYPDVFPPKTHHAGMCQERLHEVLDYAEQSGSRFAPDIRRQENLMKMRNHLIALENNFIDYHEHRLREMSDMVNAETGEQIDPESRSSKDIQFDDYEQMLMDKINRLQTILAQHHLDEMKYNQAERKQHEGKRQISVQEMNVYLDQTSKQLEMLDNEQEDNKK